MADRIYKRLTQVLVELIEKQKREQDAEIRAEIEHRIRNIKDQIWDATEW